MTRRSTSMIRALGRRPSTSPVIRATAGVASGFVFMALAWSHVGAQTPTNGGQAATQQTTPKRVFGADAGLVLNFIKPDKTADFEAVIAKLKEALQKSDKPERKQQAASWKVFKGVEP